MEELTIEQKAKRYDESIKRAKLLKEHPDKVNTENHRSIHASDYIFPELEEAEDEMMKKELISFLKEEKPYYCPNSAKRQEWVAWLEKQGGKKLTLKPSNSDDVWRLMKKIMKEAEAYELNLPNRDYDIYAFAKDILAWIEKQGEQKPVDKAEAKFHEGDKLISTINPNLTYDVLEVGHINELGNPEYKVRIFDKGIEAEPGRAYYMDSKTVDEWAKLIEQKPFDYENADITQKDFAPKIEPKFIKEIG